MRHSFLGGYFNPRAHEGHDVWATTVASRTIFQSTCPRGARHPYEDIHPYHNQFQSTCPRGARRNLCMCILPGRISIHVPTRGTTRRYAHPRRFANFNPRAHEGHDTVRLSRPMRLIFQSTCPRGARLQAKKFVHFLTISIHVPTRGTTAIH